MGVDPIMSSTTSKPRDMSRNSFVYKWYAPRHWPLWWESSGDRWIPLTKGQWSGAYEIVQFGNLQSAVAHTSTAVHSQRGQFKVSSTRLVGLLILFVKNCVYQPNRNMLQIIISKSQKLLRLLTKKLIPYVLKQFAIFHVNWHTAKENTVKPVYNDHLIGYFPVFWSSSKWPKAT